MIKTQERLQNGLERLQNGFDRLQNGFDRWFGLPSEWPKSHAFNTTS